jgi:chemotaxis protein CheZ
VFLDVAEQLEGMADNLGGEDGEKLYEMTTRMYEASNFQGITGQRITKVVSTLSFIEANVERLSRIIDGRDVEDDDALSMEDLMGADDRPDADLMHGPAMPETANSQDDIDALMASFD